MGDQTVYATMHLTYCVPGESGCVGEQWVEIGWANQGGDGPFVFTCCAQSGFRDYKSYQISAGGTLFVQMVHVGSNQYAQMLFWNGQWQVLDVRQVAGRATRADVHIEVIDGTGDPPDIGVINTTESNVRLTTFDGISTWVPWSTAHFPNTGWAESPPYDLTWLTQYYHWYGEKS